MEPASRLVFALSGLGKSELCRRFPSSTYDTDEAFDLALAAAFPDETIDARRRKWRNLCREEPWSDHRSEEFARWVRTRRAFASTILAVLNDPAPRMVLTNFAFLPWPYHAYYGIELGRYEEHWRSLDRTPDNDQTEARNSKLEGYEPLVRIAPGEFLADQPDLTLWLESASRGARF